MQVSSLSGPELMAKNSSSYSSPGPPGPAAMLHHCNQPQDSTQPAFAWARLEKLLEGMCKDGGFHRAGTRDPENSLAAFGSPINPLYGLLLNIRLPFSILSFAKSHIPLPRKTQEWKSFALFMSQMHQG